jgi:hypothetical protein
MELTASRQQVTLQVGGNVDASVTSRTHSVGQGWIFIHPFVAIFDQRAPLWTVLWIGWWFGWLGWLAAPLGRVRAIAAGALGLGGFVAASLLVVLKPDVAEVLVAAGLFASATALGSWSTAGRQLIRPAAMRHEL